jgi:hypothetical protein
MSILKKSVIHCETKMSNVSVNTTTASTGFIFTTSSEANRIKFWILFAFQFISITCYLYVFYQYSRQPQLRQSQHRVIHLLLIISFLFVTIALPLTQAYLYNSYVYPASELFCSLWTWIHYSLNIVNLFLMAFGSIERHWLIFHPWLVGSKLGKIGFYYCPLLFCLLYPPIVYMAVIFIYQCEPYYDYTQLLCTYPCYFYNTQLTNFDLYFNNYMPLLTIPIFCVVLYIRVLLQKRSMKLQAFKWKRDKKMILQLWATSSLYLAMWMPIQLTGFINVYWDPYFLLQAQIDYIYLFPYLIHLMYPFIVLLTNHKEMFNFRRNRIGPNLTFTVRR